MSEIERSYNDQDQELLIQLYANSLWREDGRPGTLETYIADKRIEHADKVADGSFVYPIPNDSTPQVFYINPYTT